MARALLINPSYRDSYGSAKAAVVDPVMPTLGLATIAAQAEKHGHKIEILDLSYLQYDYRVIREEILRRKPDVIGITGTTPLEALCVLNKLKELMGHQCPCEVLIEGHPLCRRRSPRFRNAQRKPAGIDARHRGCRGR